MDAQSAEYEYSMSDTVIMENPGKWDRTGLDQAHAESSERRAPAEQPEDALCAS